MLGSGQQRAVEEVGFISKEESAEKMRLCRQVLAEFSLTNDSKKTSLRKLLKNCLRCIEKPFIIT